MVRIKGPWTCTEVRFLVCRPFLPLSLPPVACGTCTALGVFSKGLGLRVRPPWHLHRCDDIPVGLPKEVSSSVQAPGILFLCVMFFCPWLWGVCSLPPSCLRTSRTPAHGPCTPVPMEPEPGQHPCGQGTSVAGRPVPTSSHRSRLCQRHFFQ